MSVINRLGYAALVLVAVCMAAMLVSSGKVAAQDATPVPAVSWSLTDTASTQSNDNPQYTVTIRQPKAASDDKFNAAVQKIIDAALADFKNFAKDAVAGAGIASSLDITYDLFISRRSVTSLRFSIDYYISGAAHPAHNSVTLNYDPNTGKVLQLSDLFKHDSKYLDVLSKFATDQLKSTDRLNFPDGALPKPENYQNWNLDRSGLLITFDPYTVGPGAQGDSAVFIPYYALGDLLQADYWQLW